MKVFIIHGSFGSSQENWQPWLKKELIGLKYEVIAEDFPTHRGQTLETWMKVLEKYSIGPDDVLVGHGLGATFILSIVEKYKVKAIFLVAGFVGTLGLETDDVNASFTQRDFDWGAINQNIEKAYIYHSYNDKFVPITKAKELAAKLGTKVTFIAGAGHFNEGEGYFKFPKLLHDIKKNLT